MKLLNSTKKHRFDIYDVNGSLSKPESVGIMHSNGELDHGTPNLERCENVTLFGSNSTSKETLVVKLKWRPIGGPGNKLVTLMSRLYFATSDGDCYESEEIETYEPQQVSLHSIESGHTRRILQFGSRASSLKLYIFSPYRRTRLVFIGKVRATSMQAESSAFLRLTCIMNPTAKVFDFLDQYDEQCVQQMYNAKQGPKVRSFADTINGLLLHDRHEQKCRLIGEYLLISGGDAEQQRKPLSLWGFHCRHFVQPSSSTYRAVRTKRIYSYMVNGQAYSIGNNKLDSDSIDFGYTSFKNQPLTEPISRPFEGINWSEQINENLQKFELEISDQQQTFSSKTVSKRLVIIHKAELDAFNRGFLWFEVDTNENPGYAWVSLDDELVETQQEVEAIEQSRNARELALGAGQLAASSEEASNDSELALVLDLDDARCTQSAQVGSKAASLASLISLQRRIEAGDAEQFSVPAGFATTRRAHEQFIEQNGDALQCKIKQLRQLVGDGAKSEQVQEACEQLQAQVKRLDLGDALKQQVRARLKRYANSAFKFAVRSSSWGEDEDDMSAAGQLSTLLDVENDENKLFEAILTCLASKFTYQNVEYKRQRGLPLDMPMSVIVQEMVACQKAGVMFTCDPTNGNPSVMLITANYGLGESVVSAQADPDSIRVRVSQDSADSTTKLNIEHISVGEKRIILTSGQSKQHNYDKSKCCLSDEEILQLARCALRVKRYFGSQQRDIEWGFGDSGNGPQVLHLFQARPVTGLESMCTEELLDEGSRPSQAELNFVTRANIGEVMPYAVSPLTLSASIYSWAMLGARLMVRLLGTDPARIYVPYCTTDVYYERYHSYFNLRNSVFLSLDSEAQKSTLAKSLEIGLFGREMGSQVELRKASRGFTRLPNIWEGARFNWAFKSMILMPKRTVLSQRPIVERIARQVDSGELAPSKPGELRRLIELFEAIGHVQCFIETPWFNHIVNITRGSKQNVVLTGFLSKYIEDPMQLTAATNKFLAISLDVISAEIPERVEQMARLIEARGEQELRKFVELPSGEQQVEFCRNALVSNNKPLAEQFAEFLRRFGHRCYNEFELKARSWRDEPERIADMLRLNCLAKLSSQATAERGAPSNERAKTIDDVIASLPALNNISFMDRFMIKYVLAPKSQLMVSLREQTKDIIVLQADVLRRVVRQLADELQRQLRLPDSELVFYLFYDELKELLFDHQPSIVMRAARRRQLFERFIGSEPWKYDEIFNDLTPKHMQKEQQQINAGELARAPKLFGTPASSGRVRAKVCLVNGYTELDKVRAGQILLTHSTDIAFSPVFPLVAGIITEVGGLISHGAVVAREYGLPSVIGIPNVTHILQDGEEIELDADRGTIVRISLSAS